MFKINDLIEVSYDSILLYTLGCWRTNIDFQKQLKTDRMKPMNLNIVHFKFCFYFANVSANTEIREFANAAGR